MTSAAEVSEPEPERRYIVTVHRENSMDLIVCRRFETEGQARMFADSQSVAGQWVQLHLPLF